MSADSDLGTSPSFDPASRSDWEAAASKALRGKPVDSLDTVTPDGIVRAPLYTRESHSMDADEAGLPGSRPYTRGVTASGSVLGWEIRQRHDATATGANAAILRDLERGVTGITLVSAPETVGELDDVLEGLYLDLAPVYLDSGSTSGQRGALLGLLEDRGVAGSAAMGCLGADPIGLSASSGEGGAGLDEAIATVATEAAAHAATHPDLATIAVDATVYADAGSSDSQELAAALATGVAWLRSLTDAGLDLESAASQLEFTLTAGPDQFLTIAKLRAARTAWSRIVQASGGSAAQAPMALHVETASAMMSQRDPWVNMLRTTTACFAAAVAGADAVTVQPFDSALGNTDELGLRVARNTQLILQEETHAAAVIDPAGGSWYVEDLTRELARMAWRQFQEIERSGGIVAVLADGSLGSAIAATRESRQADLASRRSPLTGVSEFPDIHETPLERTAATPGPEGDGLPTFRWAAPFEELRDAADAAMAASEPLTIYLANLGPVATHTARASFAKNLFEVGGIEAIGNDGYDGYDNAADAAAMFAGSSSRIACICSSDSMYAEHAADTAEALKAVGAERVYVAGAPGEDADALRAAGVDEWIHLGCDVLAVLQGTHELLSRPRG